MTAVYEEQGFAIVLDKILFVTDVFEAKDEKGWQFNIRLSDDLRLGPLYPTRHEAELARGLLLKALREA